MKTVFANTTIQDLHIHWVGNKYAEEGIILSNQSIPVGNEIRDVLIHYFIHPFSADEYVNLNPLLSDGQENPVYKLACELFDAPGNIQQISIQLVNYLYDQTIRPQIKNGEFYTVYFRNCVLNGEEMDAIGLFKSETKDTFLQILPNKDGFSIKSETGININKLDKGCILFNKEREKGFLVAVTDNTNKKNEAKYWTEDFLHIRPRADEYTQTQHVLSLCKEFVQNEIPNEDSVDKMKQAILVNRSLQTLKENDTIDLNQFAVDVFQQPELVKQFNDFTQEYEQREGFKFDESFHTAPQAVKRKGMGTMTTIKLDKNFVIQMFGGEDRIEKIYDDEKRMFCYKLYFTEEK